MLYESLVERRPVLGVFYAERDGSFEHQKQLLTLKAPISRLLFSSAEMFKKPLWQTVWTKVRLRAVCSGSTLLASMFDSSVMLDNHLQQTTLADDIFKCIFFLAL